MTAELNAAYRLVAADVKFRIDRAVAERRPRRHIRVLKAVYQFVNGMTGDAS